MPTVLITGASSGIGAGLAEGYAAAGATLILTARSEERLREVATRCEALGAVVYTRAVDVRDKMRLRDFILEMDTLSPIDLVIANAGISTGFAGEGAELTSPFRGEVDAIASGGGFSSTSQTPTRPSADLPPEGGGKFAAAEAVFDVNVNGVINTIHPLIPRMVARGRGQIAIMSSLAGICALPGAPAYSASKAAVRFYGDALRGALKHSGVHVSVICPGWITTPLTEKNDFPMPFLMSVEHAVHIIMHGLWKKKARIAFPLRLYIPLRLLAILPVLLSDYFFARLPSKRQKT